MFYKGVLLEISTRGIFINPPLTTTIPPEIEEKSNDHTYFNNHT